VGGYIWQRVDTPESWHTVCLIFGSDGSEYHGSCSSNFVDSLGNQRFDSAKIPGFWHYQTNKLDSNWGLQKVKYNKTQKRY